MKNYKTKLLLLTSLVVVIGLLGCVEDFFVSKEEKMLIGTWRKYDNWCSEYGTGWTDKLVLNKDHTCEYDRWGVCDGSGIEHFSGKWSYDVATRTITYNTISKEDGTPMNNDQIVISLSETNMTLCDFGGDQYYWTKQ